MEQRHSVKRKSWLTQKQISLWTRRWIKSKYVNFYLLQHRYGLEFSLQLSSNLLGKKSKLRYKGSSPSSLFLQSTLRSQHMAPKTSMITSRGRLICLSSPHLLTLLFLGRGPPVGTDLIKLSLCNWTNIGISSASCSDNNKSSNSSYRLVCVRLFQGSKYINVFLNRNPKIANIMILPFADERTKTQWS